MRESQRDAYAWWHRLRWYQKVTIAMVNGWCFGGGYGPLFACDLAFCSDEAQFGLSEVNWGILPGGRRHQGRRRADAHAQGDVSRAARRELSGKEAEAAGLVNEAVLPRPSSKRAVTEVAQKLLQKELGDSQGHQGCDAPRARNDLRQCRGLSHPRPGGTQLARHAPMAVTPA